MNLPHSSPFLFQMKKGSEQHRWVEGSILTDDSNPYWGLFSILVEVMAQGAGLLLEGEGEGFVAGWKHVRLRTVPPASLLRIRIRPIKSFGSLFECFAEVTSGNKRIGWGTLIIKKT